MTASLGREERRRSRRLPLWVPIAVASLDPLVQFYGRLETVEVSNHGCLICANRPFPRGTSLRLNMPYSKRSATAHTVRSDPIGPHAKLKIWYVALELDKAGDIWNFPSNPRDRGITG